MVKSQINGHNLEQAGMSLSGNRGIGKFDLVKVTYNVISKTLLYRCEDPNHHSF